MVISWERKVVKSSYLVKLFLTICQNRLQKRKRENFGFVFPFNFDNSTKIELKRQFFAKIFP